jgi:hypothetical protein
MHTPTKRNTPRLPRFIAECCMDEICESGRRNRYFTGKRLTPDSFRVEQEYELARRRLLNRAIHGTGVVYGFGTELTRPDRCAEEGARHLRISPGLALDACGRELLQVEGVILDLADVYAIDARGCVIPPVERPCAGDNLNSPWNCCEPDCCWLLSVHYAERLIAPVAFKDPCACDGHEWDQVCETVRYSLRRIPCDECCREPCCELECCCTTSDCCDDEKGDRDRAEKEREGRGLPPVRRGGCRCLCDYLTDLDPNPADCGLCEIREGLRLDVRHGVPLACLRLERDECNCWTFERIVDDCGPRPLVKRNDLLFDLIRGCDLTRICRIGWAEWHRARDSVNWPEFQRSFSDAGGGGEDSRYWVEFSKPVREATVHRDCFVVSIIGPEEEGGWGEPLRVPVIGVKKEHQDGDPPETVRRVTLLFDQGWVSDEIQGRKTIFSHDQVVVELEIRGDFILDCNGQAIDANAHGLTAAPTGNGTPGGTFYSNFPVGPRP